MSEVWARAHAQTLVLRERPVVPWKDPALQGVQVEAPVKARGRARKILRSLLRGIIYLKIALRTGGGGDTEWEGTTVGRKT
jgi:hypothetical protein